MRPRTILLLVVLALMAVETAFIIKGNSHLTLLKSRRARLEEALELSDRGVDLSKQGEFPKALILLEKAMKLAPGDSLISGNLKAVYFNFCVSQIGQGRYQKALDLTRQGLTLLPEDPALLYIRAESFYDLNMNDSSLACIERAFAAIPRDTAIAGLLSQLDARCRRENNLEDSQTGNFDIRFDGGENRELADRILFLLEDIRERQGAQLGWQTRRTISVVLYNKQQFSDVTRLAAWAGAAFDGKIRVPVANFQDDTGVLEKVLTHEFIHALLFEIGGKKFPAWFNEGLAQYQEGQRPDNSIYIPLSELSGSFMDLDKDKAQQAYRASLSAVEYLIAENGWDLVKLFANQLGQGGEFKAAFQETFGLSVEQFDQQWKRSIDK